MPLWPPTGRSPCDRPVARHRRPARGCRSAQYRSVAARTDHPGSSPVRGHAVGLGHHRTGRLRRVPPRPHAHSDPAGALAPGFCEFGQHLQVRRPYVLEGHRGAEREPDGGSMHEPRTLVLGWIAMLFLLAGALLTFGAGIGMVRFPDLLSRMHAASNPQVLGLIFVLIGLGLELLSVETNAFSVGSLILVALFQIVTTPVAGHIEARGGYRTDLIRRDLLSVDELAEQIDRQEREEEEARLRFR